MIWVLLAPAVLAAQTAEEWRRVLERLDRVEVENRALKEEVRALRERVDAAQPSAPERIEIHESRIEELAGVKVEASQRFPISLTGMALFNVFRNGQNSAGADIPTTASLATGPSVAGATFRQSIVGLRYHGPRTFLGGRVSGQFNMDFYEGNTEGQYSPLRIRTASIDLDWKTRGLRFGLEKAIVTPREPNSLMQLGISPLTSSGNLWRWIPQARFEQRISAGEMSRLSAQFAVVQTYEESGAPTAQSGLVRRRRPGGEFRFELAHDFRNERRIEFAPGFHFSDSHVAGYQVPSRIFTLDWLMTPWRKLEFTGAFFDGENVHHLGALRQSFQFKPDGSVSGVHSTGGWGQLSVLATGRLTFNIFGGVHDDRNSDLAPGRIARNLSGAANAMYRLAPNVVVSFEALQTRTTYIGIGNRRNNRYGLAVAYLF
jgi:hypothetical protein